MNVLGFYTEVDTVTVSLTYYTFGFFSKLARHVHSDKLDEQRSFPAQPTHHFSLPNVSDSTQHDFQHKRGV